MKVLVTGAAGFVGRHVIKELKEHDCEIIAMSREKSILPDCLNDGRVRNIIHDITDCRKDIFCYLGRPDLIIHLVWSGLSNCRDFNHFEKYLPANYYFLKQMILGGARHLAVSGSCSEYGIQNGCLSENMITNPASSYGIAKDMLRKCLELLALEYHFTFQWIRLFYTYGEGQKESSLIPLLNKALENGEKTFNMSYGNQIRDYLPIEQVAKNIVRVVFQDKVTGIINCCSSAPVTVKALVENHLKKQNKDIMLKFGALPYSAHVPFMFWGDNSKLCKIK